MENKNKKSKALIITIIIILLLLLAGYLIYKNRDAFGVKTSATIAKIFSPLISSNNSKTILAQAGEDIKKGDGLSVSGSNITNNPIVVKATNGNIYGFANQDMASGDLGEITLNSGGSNTFWDSFSGFLGNLFNPVLPPSSKCTNGADNPPQCTTVGGKCLNGATNPPECTTIPGGECINGADNPPECTTAGGECINGATNPPTCDNQCTNGADNPPQCTTVGGKCLNGATNPPECTIPLPPPDNQCTNGATNPPTCDNQCTNGADNPPQCTTVGGKCLNGATNPPECTNITPPVIPPVNACLDIEKHPLEFTDAEKSQLAELLRKFYLIAPNLKTEDDIDVTYSDITQYQNFSDHLTVLINQCYNQGIAKPKGQEKVGVINPNYKGPTTRYGNPWYKYSTLRGSYFNDGHTPQCSSDDPILITIDMLNPNCHVDSDLKKAYIPGYSYATPETNYPFDCKYISGWFSGRGADGIDCEIYNPRLYTVLTPASCYDPLFVSPSTAPSDPVQSAVYTEAKNNKCIWNPGSDIRSLEKILNVW